MLGGLKNSKILHKELNLEMNNPFLKIAFLGNCIAWGGAAKSMLLLIKALRNENYKLYLFVSICLSEEMKKEFEQYVEFVKIVHLPEITSAQTLTNEKNREPLYEKMLDLSQIDRFVEELNQLGIDILHVNNSVFSAVYRTIKSRTNVKIVSHIREWIDWDGIHQKQKFIIDEIETYSDAIICISENESVVFKEHDNLFIIPNAFDFRELECINKDVNIIKRNLHISESFFLVGMMGSFQKNKGAMDFLKALAYLKKNKSDFKKIKFVILGGGVPSTPTNFMYFLRKILGKSTFKYDIYKFLKKENLFDEVIFFSKRKNVLEIANSFDVAVRPSYTGDPWGRDIIEYMALRKPIVATGSSEYYVKNGITGFLVPPRDYKQLAEKIYQLYQNSNERKKMGERSFDLIFGKCNMNIFRSNILQVYESINL